MTRVLPALVLATAIFCVVFAFPDEGDLGGGDAVEVKFDDKDKGAGAAAGAGGENTGDSKKFKIDTNVGDGGHDRSRDRYRDRTEDGDNKKKGSKERDSGERDRSHYEGGSRGGGYEEVEYKTTSESQDNVNQFVDYILHTVGSMGVVSRTKAHIPLPKIRKHFSKKWFGINFTGEATLYNTYIENGLSTIHRLRDATLSTQRNSTHMSRRIRFEFRIKYLQVYSNFTLKFLKHGPSGNFISTTDEIVVSTEIGITSRNTKGQRDEEIQLDLGDWDYITFESMDFKLIEIWNTTKKIKKLMNPFMKKMYRRRLTDNVKYRLQGLVAQVVREAGSPKNQKALIALTEKFL